MSTVSFATFINNVDFPSDNIEYDIGAVDMDIYGSFQLCAVGVLAGPVTVRLSKTYFNTPGRNMIFVWTSMILAGLLSLTVEFFRTNPVSCPADKFTWDADDESICGLRCSTEDGPSSPLRGGSQNNIYVIKAPNVLSFGSMTLLAAACCIPAILSLVSMWNKILKVNWKKRWGGRQDSSEDINSPLPGTNNATPAKMMTINDKMRWLLSMVEVPVFGTIVLLIIIFGERNFFSYRVWYMTEPIASVGRSAQKPSSCQSVHAKSNISWPTAHFYVFTGQWAPIVGTGMAAVGSLYGLIAGGGADAEEDDPSLSKGKHCTCAQHPHHSDDNDSTRDSYPGTDGSMCRRSSDAVHGTTKMPRRPTNASSVSPTRRWTTHASQDPTSEHHERVRHHSDAANSRGADAVAGGGRRSFAKGIEWIGDKLGTPAPDRFDDSEFQMGKAADWPTTPGEELKNPGLRKTQNKYNPKRDSEGNATPLPRQRSRAGSFIGAEPSGSGLGINGPDHSSTSQLQRTETWAGPSSRRPSVDRDVSSAPRRATLEPPTHPFYGTPVPRVETSFESISSSDHEVVGNSPAIVVSKASRILRS